MREFLHALIDAEGKKIDRLRDAMISAMQNDTTTWPLDVREVDVSIDAAGEFWPMPVACRLVGTAAECCIDHHETERARAHCVPLQPKLAGTARGQHSISGLFFLAAGVAARVGIVRMLVLAATFTLRCALLSCPFVTWRRGDGRTIRGDTRVAALAGWAAAARDMVKPWSGARSITASLGATASGLRR